MRIGSAQHVSDVEGPTCAGVNEHLRVVRRRVARRMESTENSKNKHASAWCDARSSDGWRTFYVHCGRRAREDLVCWADG